MKSSEELAQLLSGAVAQHQQGRLDHAARMYEAILARQPDHFDAVHLSGVVALQRGLFENAQRLIGRAVALNPLQPAALGNLGTSYLRNHQPEFALLWFQVALGLQPESHSVLVNTATALLECGRHGAAISLLQERIKVIDAPYDAYNLLGQCLFKSGRPDEAATAFEEATLEDADRPEAWANLSVALQATGETVRARDAAQRARGYQPQLNAAAAQVPMEMPGIPMLLAAVNVLLANGLNDQAIVILKRALSLDGENLIVRWLLAIAVLKPVYKSDAELQESRRAFSSALNELRCIGDGSIGMATAHEAVGTIQPFYLVYHPYGNRDLMSPYGALCASWMSKLGAARSPSVESPPPAKHRLGIVSSHIREHSVWAAITKGWIQALDRTKFDLHIFHLSNVADEETALARRTASRFEDGPNDLGGWIEAISGSHLDAIIYPEIGMDPLTLKLAALRLAPWQGVSWGHPETSGLPTIDAFLSSELMEGTSAGGNYTEKLVRLPNLGAYFEPLNPAPSDPDFPALKLNRGEPLLLCPGAPFKYSPIFDDVWVRIAKGLRKKMFSRRSGGRLIFFKSASEILDRALESRLRAAFLTGGVDFDAQVSILPFLSRGKFYGLMSESALMLDTLGFSGFNTALQAVETGLPILAFEGEFLRGRLASGMMRMLDLPELVAATKEEFVERALELAAAPARLQALRQKIVERRSRLFRDATPVRALETFLIEAIAHNRNPSPMELGKPGVRT